MRRGRRATSRRLWTRALSPATRIIPLSSKVITRAELAKILYYYLVTSLSTAGKAYTGSDLKSDTANVTISESCTLSDATIDGDLYLTEGLASDAVQLNDVYVKGTIIVAGGTVTMTNTMSDHIVVSSPMGRLLQVTAAGAARFPNTVGPQHSGALREKADHPRL